MGNVTLVTVAVKLELQQYCGTSAENMYDMYKHMLWLSRHKDMHISSIFFEVPPQH